MNAAMQLRTSVSGIAFDADRFAALRERLLTPNPEKGTSPGNRLHTRPLPLRSHPVGAASICEVELATQEQLASFRIRGEEAIRAGKLAMVVLNGGMAMRFGGGAKGAEQLIATSAHSFLSYKLAHTAWTASALGAFLPVAVMNSFATRAATTSHLADIDWCGLAQEARFTFEQSLLPRLTESGVPVAELEGADQWPDTLVYAAPGHGDTLGRLRNSGLLAKLREKGVQHVLICNVDNLGATVDAELFGAHLENVDRGAAISVESVPRLEADTGGCIAVVDDKPVIVEGFRLPEDVSAADYPEFNTNTIWLDLRALEEPLELQWFEVRRKLALPSQEQLAIVQFEQLIGQATELVPSAYLCVSREKRFLPVKTREDLERLAPAIERLIAALPLQSSVVPAKPL